MTAMTSRDSAEPKTLRSGVEEVLLSGWLRAVNCGKGTAQLHRHNDRHVNLSFAASLNKKMKQLETLYVEARGRGRLNPDGRWATIKLEQISGTRSWSEPFDLAAFKNNPNPKIFDPDNLVTASEPFDVDEFLAAIYESRRA